MNLHYTVNSCSSRDFSYGLKGLPEQKGSKKTDEIMSHEQHKLQPKAN